MIIAGKIVPIRPMETYWLAPHTDGDAYWVRNNLAQYCVGDNWLQLNVLCEYCHSFACDDGSGYCTGCGAKRKRDLI